MIDPPEKRDANRVLTLQTSICILHTPHFITELILMVLLVVVLVGLCLVILPKMYILCHIMSRAERHDASAGEHLFTVQKQTNDEDTI